MLGSAGQNLIALMDAYFMSRVGEVEFGAIGFVGVFYLIIASIGYGFSKGGQIQIARRAGENEIGLIGLSMWSMVYFSAVLAIIMFLFMKFGCGPFFALFVNNDSIYYASLEYINYRSYGVFFSYLGVAIVALYTGVARTNFILINVILLLGSNLFFNYALIFGKFGFPEMGIGGAGLASSIAEGIAFIAFVLYIIFDRKNRAYNLFKLPKYDWTVIRRQWKISVPIIAQAIIGLGSAFVFFSIVENLGERELAITNLARILYLFLAIPSWGFASGINTLVSNFIGQDFNSGVIPVTKKTARFNLAVTTVLTLSLAFFPGEISAFIVGGHQTELIEASVPILFLLIPILLLFSFASIYFSGLVGTGATTLSLRLQVICIVFYTVILYWIVEKARYTFEWDSARTLWYAWSVEIFYWIGIFFLSRYFLKNKKWEGVRV